MRIFLNFIIIAALFLSACNNTVKDDKKMSEKEVKDTLTEHTINPGLLVNKKDPICEMPVSAGVTDTMTYKGNIIGFCSAECKAEFEKKPEDYIAKAELKIK
ncbi:MAG: YHS domain-containing protein [Bacteroidota bacterium]